MKFIDPIKECKLSLSNFDNRKWWRCAGLNRSLKTAHKSVYMFSKVEKFHFMTTQLPKAIIKLRFENFSFKLNQLLKDNLSRVNLHLST